MQTQSASTSGFVNRRLLIAFSLCLIGASLIVAATRTNSQSTPTVAALTAQTPPEPNWNEVPRMTPSPRTWSSMAYDSRRREIVLFGGATRSRGGNVTRDTNETWVWDGTSWIQRHPATSPPARYLASMAYDAVRGEVVLFGGFSVSNGRLGDTWTWNGTNWTQQLPAASPASRNSASMAFHGSTGAIVLFGGFLRSSVTDSGEGSDTWTWDGTSWTEQHPTTSPPARSRHGLSYDSARDEIVLFGGALGSGMRDTWVWDGATWIERNPNSSPSEGYYGIAMSYDSTRAETVAHVDIGFGKDETWTWDGQTWIKQPAVLPPARFFPVMAFDAARGKTVLFGGYERDDTWLWDGTGWTGVPRTRPAAPTSPKTAYHAASATVLHLGVADTECAPNVPCPSTWTWDGRSWKEEHPAISPTFRNSPGMAYHAGTTSVVLFGGGELQPDFNPITLNDTWLWNGLTWAQQYPVTSPSKRSVFTMAEDIERGQVVVFGGLATEEVAGSPRSVSLADTWTWDGTNWTQRYPINSPPDRGYASMAYDERRKQVVLFGGIKVLGAGNYITLSDTWIWDGNDWTDVTPLDSPTPRFASSMAYDSRSGKVLLHGGREDLGAVIRYPGDTWSWDGSSWTQLQPATSPEGRWLAAMAEHQATGTIMLLGGQIGNPGPFVNETWIWNSEGFPMPPPTDFVPTVLHFHGNPEDSGGSPSAPCTGQGGPDIAICDGPFLKPDSTLFSGPAARWETTAGVGGIVDRNPYDPNWIWRSGPTTLRGEMVVEWWASCGACSAGEGLPAVWRIRVWADGANKFDEARTVTPASPNVPAKLKVSVTLPEISAADNIVLQIDPVNVDTQADTRIYYDSEMPCPGVSGVEPCDSKVTMPVVGVQPLSFVSRKVHGAAGPFDIDLPLAGNAGIEPRSGGASNAHQVVFKFGTAVTATGASVTAASGKTAETDGPPMRSADGNQIIVNLKNVSNAQAVGIKLLGVSDGTTTNDVSVQMGVLLGDTSGNGVVDSGDITQVRRQSGQVTGEANKRIDLTVDGVINSGDITLVRRQSGTALPIP